MPDCVAQRFLDDFRDATARGRPLEAMVADIDGFTAALNIEPQALGAAMAAAANSAGGAASVPDAAFASAACTVGGAIVAADAAFAAWDIPPHALAAAVRQACPADSRNAATLAAPRLSAIADDATGRPVALAVALPARAAAWPLDPAVRAALASGAAAFAVLGVSGVGSGGGAARRGLAAWGFSAAEMRLASALLRTLDLRRAAQDIGVAYGTARDTLASAMARTGARRQPEFVRQLALLGLGDLPAHDATWQIFADAYGLSARAARLAQLIAFGATRNAAALALGISDHSAKADLKTVYERCGIDSSTGGGGGAALGRIVAEVDALARLAAATDVEILVGDTVSAPLRFVRRRRAPGRIAVEDHGPDGGVPVVIFHVPINGRHLPRVLVAALQAHGLRPISVERPGFGLTSPAPGATIDEVVAEANADLIDVLDALGIARTRLLGRSAIMPLSFAVAHPERVESGVLLSASPPDFRPSQGFFGAFSALAIDRPQLIDGLAKMAVRLSSDSAIVRMTEKAIGGCASDVAAFADPVNRRDFIRASRQSATGDGFAREFALHARGVIPDTAHALNWTILFGEHDPLGSGGEAGRAAWVAAMPRARVVMVDGAGRFVHLSNPERIATALAEPW